MSNPEHLTGRNIDTGATDSAASPSVDSAAMQDIVRRKMAAAELARQRGQMTEEEMRLEAQAEKARELVGTRKDGSFGLLNDDTYEDGEVRNEEEIVRPLDQMDIKPILKKKPEENEKDVEEDKEEPQLKRRVSTMWKSAIVKIRGPAVARGL